MGCRGWRKIGNEARTAPRGSVTSNRSEAQRIWDTSVAYHRWIRGNLINVESCILKIHLKLSVDKNIYFYSQGYQTGLTFFKARAKYEEFKIPIAMIPATISNNVPGTEFSLGCDTALNEISEVSSTLVDLTLEFRI